MIDVMMIMVMLYTGVRHCNAYMQQLNMEHCGLLLILNLLLTIATFMCQLDG